MSFNSSKKECGLLITFSSFYNWKIQVNDLNNYNSEMPTPLGFTVET